MTKEIWKDIPGYEGEYAISNIGRAKSLYRIVERSNGIPMTVREHILKLSLRSNGYYFVSFRNIKHVQYLVHRLVLESFVGPCPDGMQCRHLNGIKTDNRLENLCWGTPKENYHDMIIHGTSNHGERNGYSKLTADDIFDIRDKLRLGILHRVIAKQYGVCRSSISQIASGGRWGWLK